MRRPTERLLSPAQSRRSLGIGAVMSCILTARRVDRKPNALRPGRGFYLISMRRQACFHRV
jgi:hypothetical protein